MAIVTISEAARLAGKDRRTVQRHVRKGKLSKVTRAGRSVGVDTSELIRVYGDLAAVPAEVRQTAATPQVAAGQCYTPVVPDPGRPDELREAEARAARAEGERDALRERVEELRESEGHWRELAKGGTAPGRGPAAACDAAASCRTAAGAAAPVAVGAARLRCRRGDGLAPSCPRRRRRRGPEILHLLPKRFVGVCR